MKNQEAFYDNVMPVVVLYKQSLSQSLTLQSLAHNLEAVGKIMDVIVYDNSPEPQASATIFSWKYFNVFYIPDIHNSGLSKAYNTAALKAFSLKKTWIMLFDQDTQFPADFLQTYAASVRENPEVNIFAPCLELANGIVFSPCIAKHKRGYPPGNISPGKYSLYRYSPVNSGLLVRLKLFMAVGGYNESVKVDFCDFQFLEKVRRLSPDFLLTTIKALQHYSSTDISVEKQLTRFKIYLHDAVNCEKPQLKDKLGFLYAVTRHGLGLTFKYRNISFFVIYLTYFVNSKQQPLLLPSQKFMGIEKIKFYHSVCMATYNGEKFIAAQMESILLQIGSNDELIISDDGSIDETIAIIKRFKDPRIKLYQDQVFRDPIKNFQHALQQSTGKCVFLSDQDDIWMEGKYKRMLAQLEQYDLVISDAFIVDEKLEVLHNSFFDYFGSGKGVIKNMIQSSYYGSCMAFNRCVLEAALPFPDTKEIGHDLWLGFVAELKFSVFFLKEPLLKYRRHSAVFTSQKVGESRRNLKQRLYGRLLMASEILKFLMKSSETSPRKPSLMSLLVKSSSLKNK